MCENPWQQVGIWTLSGNFVNGLQGAWAKHSVDKMRISLLSNTFCLLSNHTAPGHTGGGTRVFYWDVSSPQCSVEFDCASPLPSLLSFHRRTAAVCLWETLHKSAEKTFWTCGRVCASLIYVFNLPTRWQSCLAHKRSERRHLSRCSVQLHICTTNSQDCKWCHVTCLHTGSKWRSDPLSNRCWSPQLAAAAGGTLTPRQEEMVWALMKKNGGKAGSSRLFSLDSPFKRIHGCVHAHYVNNSSLK